MPEKDHICKYLGIYTTQISLDEIYGKTSNDFHDFILECIGHPLLQDATIKPISVNSDHNIKLSIIGHHTNDQEPCNEDCKLEIFD